MILIGASAIRHWFPDFPRDPKDIDFIGKGEKKKGVEYLENPVFDNYPHPVMLPDDLYTLKISHAIGWKVNWEKHIFDIQFLSKKGCKVNRNLFYALYDYWNKVHGKNKRSDLDKTADDFFDNAVDCHVEHDFLHTIINPSPTYKKILEGEVEVSEEKFEAFSHKEKCDLVREEVMVMASERYKGMDYRHRYSKMLKKFIIGHAPIKVGIFAIENYVELHRPKYNFMNKINTKLSELNIQTLN